MIRLTKKERFDNLKGPYLGSNLFSDKTSHKIKHLRKLSFLMIFVF